MKIALLGYGRMGKEIEAIAITRGHEITTKVTTTTVQNINLTDVDVAIDFSVPNAAFNNISLCLNHNIPIVSGTTGWLNDYDKAVALCKEKNGTFIYSSNFSLGVTIFFELNAVLAKMMSSLEEYAVHLEETHHTQKLDAPSGTAITLAEGIIAHHKDYIQWQLDPETPHSNSIPIKAKRINSIPGTHSITYNSPTDAITITHTAHNRSGFALGAVIAAEWIQHKKGVFSMKDVLNIG